VSMTNSTNRVEIITSVQRRRRRSHGRRNLRAGYDGKPGGSSAWRRRKPVVHLASAGGARQPDRAAGSGEEVVPASNYRILQNQVRELHRLLGKKTLEAEILKEALEHATASKKQLRLPPSPPKDGSR
jgi:transposase